MSATMRVYVRKGHLPHELWDVADKGKPFRLNGVGTIQTDQKGLYFDWKPFQPLPRGAFINPDQAIWYATVHDRWTPIAHRTTGLYGDRVEGAQALLDREGPEGASQYTLEVWGTDAEVVQELWHHIRNGAAKVHDDANFERKP